MGMLRATDKREVSKRLSKYVLLDDEVPEKVFTLTRDQIVFTNRRIIIANVEGATGKKANYLTIPYDMIIKFDVETVSQMGITARLDIWTFGDATTPSVTIPLKDNNVAFEIQRVLVMRRV